MDSIAAATPSTLPAHRREILPWHGLLLLLVVVGVMFALNLTAPQDLESTNEERVAAFVLDIQQTGNWLCPRDAGGKLISKPPLYAWLAAISSWCLEGVTPVALRLPSVLGLFLTAAALGLAGRKYFGSTAAWLGAVAFAISPASVTQFAGARYDVLFTAMISLAALAGFAAWNQQRGWTGFWVGAAAATLVKGPFGLLLSAAGLVAALFEKRTVRTIRSRHWMGICLFILITGGWFILAYRAFGSALIERMITGELVSHTVGSDEGPPGSGFYKPMVNFATNFLPWSIFAGIGFYRIFRQPSQEPLERRFERFLFWWFAVGLITLSLASHQRARLIFPLLAPAALLAGRELTRLVGKIRFSHLIMASALMLVGVGLFFHVIRARRKAVVLTAEMREAARQLNSKPEQRFPLMHVDSLFSFQYYRCELHPTVRIDIAAELLRGAEPAFVAVSDGKKLQELVGPSVRLYELFRWPPEQPHVRILSNQERLETPARAAYRIGSIGAVLNGAEFISAGWSALDVRVRSTNAFVVLTNTSGSTVPMRVRFHHAPTVSENQRRLAPGESWRTEAR